MKFFYTKLLPALLLLFTATGCLERDTPAPLMQAEEVMQAVSGKWAVEKVEYQLCRDRNCTASVYFGMAGDYFEFRADSAFLVLTDRPLQQQQEHFKAAFNQRGSFVLTRGEWAARFEVKEVKARRLVLQSSFTGRDPNAIFTDTYHLSR